MGQHPQTPQRLLPILNKKQYECVLRVKSHTVKIKRVVIMHKHPVMCTHKPCRYLICACVFSLSKLSSDCQFGVVCSASVSWHVPGGVSDQFVIPSRLCALPAVRPWPRATLILAAPRDEAKCSTHSTRGQIKDSAC